MVIKAYLKNASLVKNNLYLLARITAVLAAVQIAACGSGGGSDSSASPTVAAGPATTTVTGTSTSTTGPMCASVGQVQAKIGRAHV